MFLHNPNHSYQVEYPPQDIKFVPSVRSKFSSNRRPPMLSSQKAGWNGILLEHHRQPAQETPERNLMHYVISIYLGQPVEVERFVNGRVVKDCRVKGDVIIATPNLNPKMRWLQAGEFLLLRLEPALVARAVQDLIEPEKVEVSAQFRVRDPLIQHIGLELKTELETDELSSRLYAESAANLLAVHLVKRYGTVSQTLRDYSDGFSINNLRRVIEYINDNLAGDVSLAAIANTIGMSQYYFARLFKQSMGLSTYQYVTQCRMKRAEQLLKQRRDMTIADIARAVGCADQSHLTRQFKRFFGVTPRDIRNL